MNKRDFLLRTSLALGAGQRLPTVAGAAPATPGRSHRRLARWPDLQRCASLDHWRCYVGESFVRADGAAPPLLQLRQVTRRHAGQPGEQFSLLFAALAQAVPSAAVWLLRHRGSGQQVPLLLQPAGTDAQGLALYRADCCRLR